MNGIEFSNTARYDDEDTSPDDGQLHLPFTLEIRREVRWLHQKQVVRRGFFGHKVVTELVQLPNLMPKATYIDAACISALNDPELRYALRFADAADAISWTDNYPESPGLSNSAPNVCVTAIDNGVDSRFVDATYTGIRDDKRDTFLENLLLAAPDRI